MKRFLIPLLIAALPGFAMASEGAHHPKQVNWEFDGVFGKPDKPSVQRGLQVYREVCAACHSLNYVSFRTLEGAGFSPDEVKALAAEYSVIDGPNDEGEMFERPGRPSDKFPSPYANEKAARALNNGAYPPDLSLIIKARADGANYLFSLLTGYEHQPPEDLEIPAGAYYNHYFPGGIIKMPPPLMNDQVSYQDGTTAGVEQMSRDVVNFLQWAAEPEMEARKRLGIKVMLFLTIMTGFFWVAKKRIWSQLD